MFLIVNSHDGPAISVVARAWGNDLPKAAPPGSLCAWRPSGATVIHSASATTVPRLPLWRRAWGRQHLAPQARQVSDCSSIFTARSGILGVSYDVPIRCGPSLEASGEARAARCREIGGLATGRYGPSTLKAKSAVAAPFAAGTIPPHAALTSSQWSTKEVDLAHT